MVLRVVELLELCVFDVHHLLSYFHLGLPPLLEDVAQADVLNSDLLLYPACSTVSLRREGVLSLLLYLVV